MENNPSLIRLGQLLHRLDRVRIVLVLFATLKSLRSCFRTLYAKCLSTYNIRNTWINTSITSATNTGMERRSYRTLDYRTIPVGEALGCDSSASSDITRSVLDQVFSRGYWMLFWVGWCDMIFHDTLPSCSAMKITLTELGRKTGVHLPSNMPCDPRDTRMSWLAFSVARGYAIVEYENETENVCFSAFLAAARNGSSRSL